jgi:hypothetical protein
MSSRVQRDLHDISAMTRRDDAPELARLRRSNDALEARLRTAHDALEAFKQIHESETASLLADREALRLLAISLKDGCASGQGASALAQALGQTRRNARNLTICRMRCWRTRSKPPRTRRRNWSGCTRIGTSSPDPPTSLRTTKVLMSKEHRPTRRTTSTCMLDSWLSTWRTSWRDPGPRRRNRNGGNSTWP